MAAFRAFEMHRAWDGGIHDGVAAGRIVRAGEAEGVLNGGDLFLVKMLTNFRVHAIEKHHEDFFLAWVDDPAEPVGGFHDVLYTSSDSCLKAWK